MANKRIMIVVDLKNKYRNKINLKNNIFYSNVKKPPVETGGG
jgi:hypothetical protein